MIEEIEEEEFEIETRQERRDKRTQRKKDRIPQHGRELGEIYSNAIHKRKMKKTTRRQEF